MAAEQPLNDWIDGSQLKELNQLIDNLLKSLQGLKSQASGIKSSFSAIDQSLNPEKWEELDNAIKEVDISAKGAEDQIAELGKELAKNQKVADKSQQLYEEQAKTIDKLTNEIDKLNKKLKEQKGETDKVLKLQKRLAEVNSDSFKEQVRLRAEINNRVKAVKQEVLGIQDQQSAYKEAVANLRRLKNEYKDLVTSQGESAEGAADLLIEIKKLDKQIKELDSSVGDNFRNVGDYASAFSGLAGQITVVDGETSRLVGNFQIARQAFINLGSGISFVIDRLKTVSPAISRLSITIGKLPKQLKVLGKSSVIAGTAITAGILGGLSTILFSTRRAQMELQQDVKQVRNFLIQLTRFIYESILAWGSIFSELGGLVKAYFNGIVSETKLIFAELAHFVIENVVNPIIEGLNSTGVFDLDPVKSSLEAVTKAREDHDKAIENSRKAHKGLQNAQGGLLGLLNESVDLFKSSSSAISEYVKTLYELQDLQRRSARAQVELNAALEVEEGLAADSSRSLQERQASTTKALSLTRELAALRVNTAKEELDLANQAIRQQLKENEFLLDGRDAYKLTNEELINLINNQELALNVSEESLQAQQEAILKLLEAEKELQVSIVRTSAERNQLRSDEAQQRLDFIKDLDERERQAIAQSLSNEKIAFTDRIAILDQLEQEFNDSVSRQLNVLETVSNNRVQVERDASGRVIGLIQTETQVRLDANELLALSNEDLAATVQTLGLSEQELAQLLDILRDVISGTEEMVQARIALDKEIEQRDIRLFKIREQLRAEQLQADKAALEAQNRTTKAQLDSLDKRIDIERALIDARFDGLAELANKEIADAEEKAATLELIEQQHQNALTNLARQGTQDRKGLTQKAFEEAVKQGQEILSSGVELANQLNENRKAEADKRLQEIDERAQQELAIVGTNEAERQRIEFEAQTARARLQREEAARQRRFTIFELFVAGAKVIANTAVAVTSQLATGNVGGAIAAGVVGGFQGAAVGAAIAGLPALEHGSSNFMGGLAIVSDSGSNDPRELVREPSGKQWLTPMDQSVVHIPKGSQVFPDYSDKTKAITQGAVMVEKNTPQPVIDYSKLGHTFGAELDKRPSEITRVSKAGLRKSAENAGNVREYLNGKVRY